MDALQWAIDDATPGLLEDIRVEIRHLWSSGAIDSEDFNLSFRACVVVALRKTPRSAEGKAIVRNLESI